MKEIRVTDPLYNIPIQIFTDISFSEWRERFNIGKWKSETSVGGFTRYNKKTWGSLIWLNKVAWPEILIHELWHAIHWALKDRGFTPNSLAGEETYAYLFQYFYKKLNQKGVFENKKAPTR